MFASKPVFIKTTKEFYKLNKDKCKPVFVDALSRQIKELFMIENPRFSIDRNSAFSSPEFKNFVKKKQKDFNHIYFPWSNHIVKCVKEKDYFKLKTNRNRDLITKLEQKKLADFTVGIVGLSVGGNTATALIHNGFSKNIKLADFDKLDTTNLNRVRAKLSDIGVPKIDIIKRQIFDTNPYVKISSFPDGLNRKNLKKFFVGNPKPKLVFELIDDFEMKILLRKEAKKDKIPVIMLTSLGDSVLIDVERYDIEPKVKLFNGKVGDKVLDKILAGNISEQEKHQYAIDIVDVKNLPAEVKSSIKQIGKTLAGRPQLMSTVTVASGFAVFLTRKIALREKVKSGRTLIKLDDFIK